LACGSVEMTISVVLAAKPPKQPKEPFPSTLPEAKKRIARCDRVPRTIVAPMPQHGGGNDALCIKQPVHG
jgi:hypothetical protein